MTFGLRLALWYGFVFVVAATALLVGLCHLMDDSIDKEWRVTRSKILATGKTSARVPVHSGRGELNTLVGLFNQMLDKNDNLVRAMHESLDNVAHDLRTPMTRLRGSAENALRKAGDATSCREALEDCMEESDRVLTVLSDEQRALTVGITKAMKDSTPGGSGFSFVDMAANQAGIRFAAVATRNPASAQSLQQLIAGGVTAEDLFPAIAGLPEGISADDFHWQYGGLGGAETRRLFNEIDHRLDALRGFQ
jgi:signal transduction histidine kinase